jgi:hypothetical protein
MTSSTTLSRLAPLAEDQWGLLTRLQAAGAGVSEATLGRLAADGSVLQRVGHGVYHLAGAPRPDLVELRAAWLQLAPGTPVWDRVPAQGVVSHRSAAAVYSLGHLPADSHDFTVPTRRQSRRSDVHMHRRPLGDADWASVRGLLVTRPTRIVADLLRDREDPGAVGHIIADALRTTDTSREGFAGAVAQFAVSFGLDRRDGVELLNWLLGLTTKPALRI